MNLHGGHQSDRTLKTFTLILGTNRRVRRTRFGQVPRQKDRKLQKHDLQQNRAATDNYVTGAWLKGRCGKVCHDCGDCFRFDVKDGRAESNFAADRVDDDDCHHLTDIVPLCVICNQRKSRW